MVYLDIDRVEMEWWIAYFSVVISKPINVINNVGPSQRLQYPSEKKLTMIQRVKEKKHERLSCPPTIEV
jgi:hypothetical protein